MNRIAAVSQCAGTLTYKVTFRFIAVWRHWGMSGMCRDASLRVFMRVSVFLFRFCIVLRVTSQYEVVAPGSTAALSDERSESNQNPDQTGIKVKVKLHFVFWSCKFESQLCKLVNLVAVVLVLIVRLECPPLGLDTFPKTKEKKAKRYQPCTWWVCLIVCVGKGMCYMMTSTCLWSKGPIKMLLSGQLRTHEFVWLDAFEMMNRVTDDQQVQFSSDPDPDKVQI